MLYRLQIPHSNGLYELQANYAKKLYHYRLAAIHQWQKENKLICVATALRLSRGSIDYSVAIDSGHNLSEQTRSPSRAICVARQFIATPAAQRGIFEMARAETRRDVNGGVGMGGARYGRREIYAAVKRDIRMPCFLTFVGELTTPSPRVCFRQALCVRPHNEITRK